MASEGLGFLEGEGAGAAHEEDARLHMASVRLLASELGKVRSKEDSYVQYIGVIYVGKRSHLCSTFI